MKEKLRDPSLPRHQKEKILQRKRKQIRRDVLRDADIEVESRMTDFMNDVGLIPKMGLAAGPTRLSRMELGGGWYHT